MTISDLFNRRTLPMEQKLTEGIMTISDLFNRRTLPMEQKLTEDSGKTSAVKGVSESRTKGNISIEKKINESQRSSNHNERSKSKLPIFALGEWRAYRSSTGNIYYYSVKTKITQWEKPQEIIEWKKKQKIARKQALKAKFHNDRTESVNKSPPQKHAAPVIDNSQGNKAESIIIRRRQAKSFATTVPVTEEKNRKSRKRPLDKSSDICESKNNTFSKKQALDRNINSSESENKTERQTSAKEIVSEANQSKSIILSDEPEKNSKLELSKHEDPNLSKNQTCEKNTTIQAVDSGNVILKEQSCEKGSSSQRNVHETTTFLKQTVEKSLNSEIQECVVNSLSDQTFEKSTTSHANRNFSFTKRFEPLNSHEVLSDLKSDACKISRTKVVIEKHMAELVYNFTKYTLQVLPLFSEVYPNYIFVDEDRNKMIEICKYLSLVLIFGPIVRAQSVIQDILMVIFECFEESSLVRVFSNFILGHSKTSKLFSTAILHRFSQVSCLEYLAERKGSSVNKNLIVTILNDVLRYFLTFPENFGEYEAVYLESVIKRCIEVMPVASHPSRLIMILDTIYRATFLKTNSKFSASVYCMMPYLCETFDILLIRPVKHKTWIALLNIILNIFISVSKNEMFNDIIPYVKTFCKCLIYLVKEKENPETCLKALEMFEWLLDKNKIDLLNLSILPLKEKLLDALFTAMKYPDKKVTSAAFIILGKLGCYNRDNFTDACELQEERTSLVFGISFGPNQNTHCSLGKCILDVTHNTIKSPYETVQKKKLFFAFLQAYLKVLMEAAKKSGKTVIGNTDVCHSYKRALVTMFAATNVHGLSDDAIAFKDEFLKKYINLFCVPVKNEAKNLFLLLLEATFEAISEIKIGSNESIDISPLNDIISMAPKEIFKECFLQHVVENAINLCYNDSWDVKIIGCKVINYIMEITDYEWKMNHICEFVEPLLYSTVDNLLTFSFGDVKEPILILEKLLKSVPKDIFLKNIRDVLTKELFSPEPEVRKQIRRILMDLVKMYRSTLKDLLTFSNEYLNELTFIARLYEDYGFSYSLKNVLNTKTSEERNKLYNDLKSFFIKSASDLAMTDFQNLKAVKKCCGALCALCFNFIDGVTVREICQINIEAMEMPVDEISETSSECLKYILKEHIKRLGITIDDLADRWFWDLKSSLVNPLPWKEKRFRELFHFMKIFNCRTDKEVSKTLINAFHDLRLQYSAALEKEYHLTDIENLLERISTIMELLPLLYHHDLADFYNSKVLFNFMADVEPHIKLFSLSKLKKSLLTYSSFYSGKPLILELSRMKESPLWGEVLVMSEVNWESFESKDMFLYLLPIINHILQFNPSWLKNKQKLANCLLRALEKKHRYLSKTESSLQTFFQVKECKLILKCLIENLELTDNKVDMLFKLVFVLSRDFVSHFQDFKDYVLNTVANESQPSWFRACMKKFTCIFLKDELHPAELEMLEFIIIPSFFHVIRKGSYEDFFITIHKKRNHSSVIDLFLICMNDLSRHSRKVQQKFMKLTADVAEQLHLIFVNEEMKPRLRMLQIQYKMSPDYFQLFQKEVIKFTLAYLRMDPSCLTQCTLIYAFGHMHDRHVRAKSLQVIAEYTSGINDFTVEKMFYFFASNLPPRASTEFCHRITSYMCKSKKFLEIYLDRILNVIFVCKEELYTVAHVFVKFYMKLKCFPAPETTFFIIINKIIDLIDIVTYPERSLTRDFDVNEIMWIMNLLLQNVHLQEISDKCFSLLKKIMIHCIRDIKKIKIGVWLVYKVREAPGIEENFDSHCAIFKLLTEISDDVQESIIHSFIDHTLCCIPKTFYRKTYLTSSQMKFVKNFGSLLINLKRKYHPDSRLIVWLEEVIYLYCFMDMCLVSEDRGLVKAVMLETMGQFIEKEYDVADVTTVVVSYLDSTFHEYDGNISNAEELICWLNYTAKGFKKLSEEDKRELFAVFFREIEKINFSEIILPIITILGMSVDHLIEELKIPHSSSKKWRTTCKQIFFYEVFVMLGLLSSRIKEHSELYCDEEINMKLLEVLMKFRKQYGSSLLQDPSIWSETFPLHETSMRIDEHRELEFKRSILFIPCGFYNSACREKFFEQIKRENILNIFYIFQFIFENKFFVTIPEFHIAYYITWILFAVKDMWIGQESAQNIELVQTQEFLSSLTQLCYEDRHLAEHVWMRLFPSIWTKLEKKLKEIICCSKYTKAFLKDLSARHCSEITTPSDCFINTAVKAMPEMCFNVDYNYIKKSCSFQLISKQILEHSLTYPSQKKSSKNYKTVKLLSEIYEYLEEKDLYYCLKENCVELSDDTKTAMIKFQNNELIESCERYRSILQKLKFLNFSKRYQFEKEICSTEYRRCMEELMKWDMIDLAQTTPDIFDSINLFSKWNITESGHLTLNLKPVSEETPLNHLFWKEIPSKCTEMWKSLPKCFIRRHYSLLQLTQEITEYNEARNCDLKITEFSSKSSQNWFNEIHQAIKDVFSKWKERSYLFSDDYQFLTEIFHIRLAYLKCCFNEYKGIANSSLFNECFRYVFEIKREINESLFELCSLALKCRKVHIKNVKFELVDDRNIYSLLNLKLLSLLNDVGPFSKRKSVIKEKIELLSTHSCSNLDASYHVPSFDAHVLTFFHDLGLEVNFSVANYFKLQVHAAQLYEILCEQEGKDFNPRRDMKITSLLLGRLLQICNLANNQDVIKILPKVLHILEYDDTDCDLSGILQKWEIPTRCWLPFLSHLIALLFRTLNKESSQKTPLSYVLTNILMKIGENFPQEVFFSIFSLKEKAEWCDGTESIFNKSKRTCIPCTDIGKSQCDRILHYLRSKHTKLIGDLEDLANDFKNFSPKKYEIDQIALKKVIEEVFHSFYKDFESSNNLMCSRDIIYYLQRSLRSLLCNSDIVEDEKIEQLLMSTQFQSYLSVFELLRKLLNRCNNLSKKGKKRVFYIDKRQPLLSNFCNLNEHISVFGQSPMVDSSYQVKMLKIHRKVEVQSCGDYLAYKFSILGNDGKVHSFLINEGLCKIGNLNRMKCIEMLNNMNILLKNNTECAKRFLCAYFPRITAITPHLIITPCHHEMIFYQNIVMPCDKGKAFSPHMKFTKLFIKKDEKSLKFDSIVKSLEIMKYKSHPNSLEIWVENLYASPFDLYSFKKEFIKHISMLIALEYFLNISMKNELVVLKKSGIVSAVHPEINFHNLQNISVLLTPNIQTFIGAFRMHEVAKYVYVIASCFKEHAKILESYLYLLKMDYCDVNDDIPCSPKLILQKLENLKREDVPKLIDSSNSDDVLKVNPLSQPFF